MRVVTDRIGRGGAKSDGGSGPRPVDPDAGRRAFVAGMGLGAAVLGAGFPSAAWAQGAGDADVLNFALNLEYLQAEFHLRAAFGRGLADEDTGGQGALGSVAGGRAVVFATPDIAEYVREIASDEEAHVRFLRSALGAARVARPAINLRGSFTTAARAAGLIGLDEVFDAYANENNFLLAAFLLEDVGVTAYKGLVPLMANRALLEPLAGILAVEAHHAGAIRLLVHGRRFLNEALRVSTARDALDGPGTRDQGVGTAARANIVPADENAIAFGRTPRQVLNVLHLQAGASEGGFFPAGINGPVGRA